jgi:ribosomal protein S18 acetylase RimI-like enzyme
MNLHFMSASEADIPVIYAQAKNLIDTYEDLASIDYDKVMDWVRRKISKHISSYTAVVLSDKPCAYYRLCDDGELDDLYVLPDFQNRGIGSKILEKCILESVNPLYLYVFSANTRAISFYEKHGFSLREKVGKTRLILNRKG